MHDHVVNFRADLDICGEANTLVRTHIQPVTHSYAWDKPEVPGPRNTMHMKHETVTHETGLDWPRNSAEMYLITAPNATNKWGETRAYRVLPGTGMGNPAHLTILNSTTLGNSATWSASDLWVLKNHPNTEPGSAHHLNALEPLSPLVDFARMADGEAIDAQGEDLVLYFNLGGHHVPSSQDVPNTLMHTSASSVMFVPFNYFDEDVSRALRQGVRIDRRAEAEVSKDFKDSKAGDKGEIRRSAHGAGLRNAGAASTKSTEKDLDGGVTYFGARYTSPVQVAEEMLSPDLSRYMEERDKGEEGGWKVVRNRVGGGLYGLFVGKERGQGEKGGGRMDW
jgi:primary-amine oxidase